MGRARWVSGALAATMMLIAPMATGQDVTVFAAASLRRGLDAVAAAWQTASGGQATISYGTTLSLAQQIDAGAPADVFISGDPDWMDYLDGRGVIKSSTTVKLLANRLVLVAPARSDVAIKLAPGVDLAQALSGRRLAMPNVETLPGGRSGKQALMALGAWEHVVKHVTQTESMRSAVALVAAGQAALGIVYITEAVGDPGIRIVDTFPEETHAPIVYQAAETAASADGDAAMFLDFLRTRTAAELFEARGFTVLAPVVED
jgi:molybdate transport system substrate-binding protein